VTLCFGRRVHACLINTFLHDRLYLIVSWVVSWAVLKQKIQWSLYAGQQLDSFTSAFTCTVLLHFNKSL